MKKAAVKVTIGTSWDLHTLSSRRLPGQQCEIAATGVGQPAVPHETVSAAPRRVLGRHLSHDPETPALAALGEQSQARVCSQSIGLDKHLVRSRGSTAV